MCVTESLPGLAPFRYNFLADARKNRRYKSKTKTKTYLKRKISEF